MANNKTIFNTGIGETALLREVAMGGSGLTLVVDADTFNIKFASSLFEKYTGYALADATTLNFVDLLDPSENAKFQCHISCIRDVGERECEFYIYRVKRKNGSIKSFYAYISVCAEAYYQLYILPDKSSWGMPFSSSESKELFLEHFESEGYGTFEWIVGADISYWSAGVYRIYEVDEDIRFIDYFFASKFVHPDDKDWVLEASKKAMSQSQDLNIEFRIVTARNNIKVLHSLARAVKDSKGQLVKVIGSVRDVTWQRNAEVDLLNNMEELKRSNRELEEFAYAASHDLQEPLRKITTFSERLLDKNKELLTGESSMYLSRMMLSAENMRQLINGLLEFSRIAKASQPFDEVSLSDVIKQVKNDLELKVEETNTVIECDALPTITAEVSQMKQLFTNLISNAIKFHKKGIAPLIKISSNSVSLGEMQVYGLSSKKLYHKITVTDNGIGFEGQYASRIFQVFQRLHGKSEYPGSGIGLAICKKILEYHNGVIFAKNALDGGAVFTIIIPEKQ